MPRRLILAVLLAALGVLAGPLAGASAAPSLSVSTPEQGGLTNETKPLISGHSSDSSDGVTVTLFAGSTQIESTVVDPELGSGSWAVRFPSDLPDGSYLVVAEQLELLTGEGSETESAFTVFTAKPDVTLNAISSPTSDSTPSFKGTASEHSGVTVYVFAGGSAEGELVREAHASGTGGSWTSGAVSPALPDGTYTALAEQGSEFGNGPGFSQERTFTVNTAPPTVTLNPITSPTGDTSPSFSGTASDTTSVTVVIFKGGSASGSPVSSAHAGVTAGKWTSGGASPGLADGSYTAVAVQESSLGNGDGASGEIHFTVDTAPPEVELNGIASPTNDTTPSFTGFASDTTTVTVLVFKGSSASGSPVATAAASGTGGGWSSGSAAPELADGPYTAIAVQNSSLGNGEGVSDAIHFTVQTGPPTVTLSGVQTPSGNTTPSFSGSASDTTAVSILIYAGNHAGGSVVSGAAATGTGGGWSSGHASPALASGEYTAVAIQESSLLGNPAGVSNEVTFVVDTSSPAVTLNSVPSPSNDTTPSFSGTASDSKPVIVHVFNGADQEVATASGTPSGGAWKAGAVSKALSSGGYTAVASEASSLGNPDGTSNTISFSINTESPHITLEQPPKRSNVATPAFSGTTNETTGIKVFVFAGTKATGTPVATLEVAGTGGTWTSAHTPTLPDGIYTALAEQQSSVGNEAGRSPERTFEIATKAPGVTLTAPPKRTKQTTMSFEGTAEDSTTVTVSVYRGESVSGTLVGTTTAPGGGGTWKSGSVGGLSEGTYTVIARQESSIAGNPRGESNAAVFTVETKSPTVTIAAVAPLSNDATPTFSGTATDTTPVFVHVLHLGVEVADVEATSTGTSWTATSPALSGAKQAYTAFATQASAVGNPEAKSSTISFEINTEPPAVTIQAIPTPSNNRSPSFTGEASDTKPVVVHVLHAGKEVASAEAVPSGHKWKAGPVKPALAAGDNAYTAYATEASSLGNPDGKSTEVGFIVDTEPPVVTLQSLPTPSNNRTPTFTGTASDTGEVKVVVTGGGKKFEASGAVRVGSYTVGPITLPATKALYKAVATQGSSIGNAAGESKSISFVVDPGAPSVSMTPPREQINTATPSFSGTAGDSTPVTVAICRASSACGAEAGEWTAKSTAGGAWTATETTPLEDGDYQAIASERSLAGDLGATGAVHFSIDTRAPAVAISTPTDGSVIGGGSLLVTGSAGTAAGDRPSVTVQLFAGSSISPGQSPLQNIVSVPVSAGSWSITLGGLSPGAYSVRAQQSDEAGNVGFSAAPSFLVQPPAAAAGRGPAASFNWYPANPHVGEAVTLVSSSTDDASPITAYSWNLLGASFAPGAQRQAATFSTPGGHTVALRVLDANGQSSTASQVIPVNYVLMKPFPVVRISGTRSTARVRLKVLTVQAPTGAKVTITCTGKGCPLKSQTRLAAAPKPKSTVVPLLAFPRFERSLPAGSSLVVRVMHAGEMGKYTRFAIRRGKLPVRTDACLNALEPTPVPCTS